MKVGLRSYKIMRASPEIAWNLRSVRILEAMQAEDWRKRLFENR